MRQGVILCGRENDVDIGVTPPKPFVRPPWALDGSFLTLRYLFQRVPEFTKFLKESADPLPGFMADLIGVATHGPVEERCMPVRDSEAVGLRV